MQIEEFLDFNSYTDFSKICFLAQINVFLT